MSDGNSYKFGSSRRCVKGIYRYEGNFSLVRGREVVGGGQLLGGHHPRAAILSAVDLLLDELGRRLGRLQNA